MEENTQQRAPLGISVLLKDRRVWVGILLTLGALLVLWIVGGLLNGTVGMNGVSQGERVSAPGYGFGGGVAMEEAYDYDAATVPSSVAYGKGGGGIAPYPYPAPGGGTGTYEEAEYETRDYSAHIKTSAYDETCDTVERWKPLPYVIFENASRGDVYCSYRLKVERESADAMLAEVQKLNPRDITEQTEIVKRQLVEYTSQLEILQKQQDLLTKTLDDVTAAYDELVALSKEARDVETLAKVIDGKLRYVEDLSQRRINVAAQLDAMARMKAELTDRIAYVYFTISVEKVEYVNGEELKDSWVYAVRAFVADTNEILQSIAFGIFELILWLMQALLQLLILFVVGLFVAKHGWRAAKQFWQS